MPAVTIASFPTIFRFSPRKFIGFFQGTRIKNLAMKPSITASATEAKIRPRRTLFFLCSGVLDMLNQAITRVAVASNLGGFSKVWNGAGDGTSHSKPSAPSQGFCAAFSPLPNMPGSTMNKKKYT